MDRNMPMCIVSVTPAGCLKLITSMHNWEQTKSTPKTYMKQIVLLVILVCNNGHNCIFHPCGWGISLVLNHNDYGISVHLHLCVMVQHEHLFYTINSDGTEWCHVCFVAWECAAEENGHRLDGTIIQITEILKLDNENQPSLCFVLTITTVVTHIQLMLIFNGNKVKMIMH